MWQLAGTHATVNSPSLRAELDLAQPAGGLQNLVLPAFSPHIVPRETYLLAVHFSGSPSRETVEDGWIRGSDLCGRYGESAARPFFPEVYWRILDSSRRAIGLELIVSARTNLLDALPATWVGSRMSAEEFVQIADPDNIGSAQTCTHQDPAGQRPLGCGLLLVRPQNANYSYAEMVFPSDLTSVETNWSGQQLETRWRLFSESLEKGVIRRARIRGWLFPREHDLAAALQRFREFTESELPLTT